MSFLILLGIGAIYGIASLNETCKPSNPPPTNSRERVNQCLANNQKKIDKIMRRYGGRR